MFVVTMGNFEGAEIWQFFSTYLLFLLAKTSKTHQNTGFHRHNGLVICKATPCNIENTKEQIMKHFIENSVKIRIEANMKCINFTNAPLNLHTNLYKPYKRSNNNIHYVHQLSNHPPATTTTNL